MAAPQAARLGTFLRSRRARITPAEIGLRPSLGIRRVPGLRREELAAAAGVSVDYYTRLEQGRAQSVSDAVLDAIGRVLRLDPSERTHLGRLARPVRARRQPSRRVRQGLQLVLDQVADVPAFVLGRRMDVLAWNRMACLVIADFPGLPPRMRNMPRLAFGQPDAAEHYRDWAGVAEETVAYLRWAAGRDPDDPLLAELIDELSTASTEFRRIWSSHAVHEKTFGAKLMRHPLVGDLDFGYETLAPPGDAEQTLVIYTVVPDSPTAQSLRLLASWNAPLPAPPVTG